ncbi:MAG: DUF58 domain-containing protein [Phycisphaeraceae bacterium]
MASSTTGNAISSRYLRPGTLQRLKPLDLVARELVEGMRVGVHKSPLKGFSTEFAQHRPYVPGDTLKHIDWRVYGRSGRYYIKLFEAETNFESMLLLDASSSMHFAGGGLEGMSKLEYAKYCAAALAYLVVDQRDAVGLGVFDSALRTYIPPSSSQAAIRQIAGELEGVGHEPKTDVAGILHEFARRLKRRGVVILFSDLLGQEAALAKGLEHLRHRGHNVIVFHVMDAHELSFPFTGNVRFRDLEGPDQLLADPRRIRAAYMKELEAFLDRVRLTCERAKVDYVLADTSRPIEALLSGYLVGRAEGR